MTTLNEAKNELLNYPTYLLNIDCCREPLYEKGNYVFNKILQNKSQCRERERDEKSRSSSSINNIQKKSVIEQKKEYRRH